MIPGQGTKIPHAVCAAKKKKKLKKINKQILRYNVTFLERTTLTMLDKITKETSPTLLEYLMNEKQRLCLAQMSSGYGQGE